MDWQCTFKHLSIAVIFGVALFVAWQHRQREQWGGSGKVRNTSGASANHRTMMQQSDFIEPKHAPSRHRRAGGSMREDEGVVADVDEEYNVDGDDVSDHPLVPEYVEEMNEYRAAEHELVGASIANVYDHLTRAPDISAGRDVHMVSDSGISPIDPFSGSWADA
jgi:hypothetical protein